MIPLSKDFQVYVIEIRRHGKSSWTSGNYSWKTIGMDMKSFLEEVVQGPAILSGIHQGELLFYGVQPMYLMLLKD